MLLQLPSIPPCLSFNKQKLQVKLCWQPWFTQCLSTSSRFDIFAKKIPLSSLERLSTLVGQRDAPASWEETSYLLSLPSHPPVFRTLASSSGNKTSPAQLPVPTCHGMAQRENVLPVSSCSLSHLPENFVRHTDLRKPDKFVKGLGRSCLFSSRWVSWCTSPCVIS